MDYPNTQRWSTLRKKDCSTNTGTNVTNTQYTTAEQLATRHSLSLALDMPFKKLTAPGMTNPNPGNCHRTLFNFNFAFSVHINAIPEVAVFVVYCFLFFLVCFRSLTIY